MPTKDEAKLILKGVGKGLSTILFPPKKEEKPSEYMQMHYCEQCKGYHKAKG